MSDNKSSNKRLAKNSMFLSIRMVIVLAISLYTTRIVLQTLGVIDYGIYNVVCGFVLLFGFLNTSMSNGIQRFINYEYSKSGEIGAREVFCTSVVIQILLSILVVVTLEIIGLWYLHNKMVIPVDRMVAAEWIFQFAIISFVIGILQAPFAAAVTAHEKFDFYAIVSVIDAVLKLIAVFLLQLTSIDKLIIYGAFITLVCLIGFIIHYVYCKIIFREIRFSFNYCKLNLLKKMLAFSGWNLFGSLSGVMEVQGINLVINFFYGPVVNAARGIATQINAGVMAFVGNISTPVRPQVTQSYAIGDVDRTINLTYSVSKISCAIILILSIPASIEMDYIMHMWLGNTIPNHAVTFTVLVLITQLVNSLNAAISNVVHATGIMKEYQLWSGIVRLCSIPLSIILLKLYSIPELALIAVFICSCISHLVGLVIVRNLVPISLQRYFKNVVWPILLVLVIGVLMTLIPHFILNEGFLRLIIVSIWSFIVISLSFFFIVFNENERNLSIQLLNPVISFFKF